MDLRMLMCFAESFAFKEFRCLFNKSIETIVPFSLLNFNNSLLYNLYVSQSIPSIKLINEKFSSISES